MLPKKRYIALCLFILFLLALQLEFFAFRKTDEQMAAEVLAQGQSQPRAYDLQYHGQTIHYTQVGEAGKPLLLFVHGAPGSSSAMLPFLADTLLSRHTQLIIADRPGYGFSGYGVAEPSLEKQAGALLAILDEHVAPKVILVGHSYGGPVIARMAADAPDLIDGLVFVAASVDPALEPREWWRGPADWPLIRSLIPGSFRVCNQEIMALYHELQLLLPLWEEIRCPAVVFQGSDDRLVPAENAYFLQEKLTNSPRVEIRMIQGANHFILWSMQEEIIRHILPMIR